MSLYPTRIVRLGLDVPPAEGEPAKSACDCMMCGRPISAGSPAVSWRPAKSTFTDFQYLVSDSRYLCVDCAPFIENRVMIKTQKVVANEHGAWKLSKDSHRIDFVLDPPETPFVAVISDSMKQHLVWKAHPTVDRDFIRIQVGRQSLSIDRPLALEAAGWARMIADRARAEGIRLTPNHPFLRLDRDLASPDHGQLRTDVAGIALRHDDTRAALEGLLHLGPGELWALSFLAKSRSDSPLREPADPVT